MDVTNGLVTTAADGLFDRSKARVLDDPYKDHRGARTMLGWKPQHSLRETLPKMVSELKADPFTWYHENELKLPRWLRKLMPLARS